MARRPNSTCNGCGKAAWRPEPKYGSPYRCHECRRLEPQAIKPVELRYRRVGRSLRTSTCEGCGAEFKSRPKASGWTRYCTRQCWLDNGRKPRAVATEWTSRLRRQRRESDTPGLSRRQRNNLLLRLAPRGCYYCNGPAETVDHVVPLARGGTNYEGNLVPCCKRCNSSKSDLLIIEWRLGKPHGGTITHRPWMDADWIADRPKAASRPKVQPDAKPCAICGCTYQPRSKSHRTCGPACSLEWAKRAARNNYRAKVGLPEDWTTPTRPHRAA